MKIGTKTTEKLSRPLTGCAQELVVISGRNAVKELLSYRRKALKQIFVSQSAILPKDLALSVEKFEHSGGRVTILSQDELLKSFPESRQGIVAQARSREPLSVEDFINTALNNHRSGQGSVILVADQVVDPANLGALFRLGEAGGISGICITRRRSSPVTDTVRRVSMGASEFIPHCLVDNLQQTFKLFKKNNIWVAGTSLDDTASNLYEVDVPTPLAVVVGSEHKGIRTLTANMCDILLRVPMHGVVQSLNVSQAASVVVFELLRRGYCGREHSSEGNDRMA